MGTSTPDDGEELEVAVERGFGLPADLSPEMERKITEVIEDVHSLGAYLRGDTAQAPDMVMKAAEDVKTKMQVMMPYLVINSMARLSESDRVLRFLESELFKMEALGKLDVGQKMEMYSKVSNSVSTEMDALRRLLNKHGDALGAGDLDSEGMKLLKFLRGLDPKSMKRLQQAIADLKGAGQIDG